MIRFDYTDYEKLLDSLAVEEGPFNPHRGSVQEYMRIMDGLDPAGGFMGPQEKMEYVMKYIVPALKEYCKDMRAVLEVDEGPDRVRAAILSPRLIIIEENMVLKSILSFATFFMIERQKGDVKLELFFAAS